MVCEHYAGLLGVAHFHQMAEALQKHVSTHSDLWPLPRLAAEATVQCTIRLISEGYSQST